MSRFGARPRLRTYVMVICAVTLTGTVTARSLRQVPSAPPGGAPGVVTPQPRDRAAAAAPKGDGTLKGRVVRADSGAPLPRARVVLGGMGGSSASPFTTSTDDAGRFQFANVPAGQYALGASKTGFISTAYGQPSARSRSGAAIELRAGQTLENLNMALEVAGAVEGRILDEFGEPTAGASVQLMRRRYENGERRMVSASRTVTTDDRGLFRIYGVAQGTYFLQASVSPIGDVNIPGAPNTGAGAVPTFLPGTVSPSEAQAIPLAAGAEVSGVVLQIIPVRLATVTGTLQATDGRSVEGATVRMGNAFSTRQTAAAADGTFAFRSVAPGEYTALATLSGEVAIARLQVNGDDAAIQLIATKAPTARGRVRFDSGAPPADVQPTRLRVTLIPVDGTPNVPDFGATMVGGDWTFNVAAAGRRIARISPPEGWSLKSVMQDATEVTDTPIDFVSDVELDFVLTRSVTELSGRVVDKSGAGIGRTTVVVLADDPQRWGRATRFVRTTSSNPDGSFTIRGLPAATYVALAVNGFEPGDEQDPEILETFRTGGTRVALADGERKTVSLRVAD